MIAPSKTRTVHRLDKEIADGRYKSVESSFAHQLHWRLPNTVEHTRADVEAQVRLWALEGARDYDEVRMDKFEPFLILWLKSKCANHVRQSWKLKRYDPKRFAYSLSSARKTNEGLTGNPDDEISEIVDIDYRPTKPYWVEEFKERLSSRARRVYDLILENHSAPLVEVIRKRKFPTKTISQHTGLPEPEIRNALIEMRELGTAFV